MRLWSEGDGMSKHTPGSWKWAGESYRDASGSQEDVVIICTEQGKTVAVIHEPYSDVVAANARLIAAAPDLLTVLQKVRGYIHTLVESNVLAVSAWHSDIDAVLAAATGEQP